MRRMTCVIATVTSILWMLGCAKQTEKTSGVGECAAPGPEYTLEPPNTPAGVSLVGQEQDNWCWAASGQMILGYYGKTIKQCTQVSDRYPRVGNCCSDRPPADCRRKTGWPEFCKHEVDAKIRHNAGLRWDEIKEQIGCQHNPIAFTWKWADGVKGHMMVAFGYGTDSSSVAKPFLWVRNPLPVGAGKTEKIFYTDYLPDTSSGSSSSPVHTHWDDFYDFQVKQNVACTKDNWE